MIGGGGDCYIYESLGRLSLCLSRLLRQLDYEVEHVSLCECSLWLRLLSRGQCCYKDVLRTEY